MVADVVPRHMCVYSYTARVCDKDKVRTRYYSSLFTPCLYARKHLKGLNLNTSLFPADAVRELEQATFLVIKAWIRREPTALTPKNVGRDRAILSAWPRRYRQQVPTPRSTSAPRHLFDRLVQLLHSAPCVSSSEQR
jgi:hypothetical protein